MKKNSVLGAGYCLASQLERVHPVYSRVVHTSRGKRLGRRARKGSVMGLFAILLPAVVMMCALAINIAYIQLVNTELKIATDASARAAGRAMSIHQTTDAAMDYAQSTAALNMVAGQPLVVQRNEQYIKFGRSGRANGGYGRYTFTPLDKSRVDSGAEQATSVRVLGSVQTSTLLRYAPTFTTIKPQLYSTATQVDRDIVLIFDRSGSMGDYQDWTSMQNSILDLYSRKLISKTEKNNAIADVYSRTYSTNVKDRLSGNMKEYAQTYQTWINGGIAPKYSRWYQLEQAANAFVDVLETTDQEELVSVVSFSDTATLDLNLDLDYDLVRSLAHNKRPYGGTAIGKGLQTGLPPLLNVAYARPFASKTIVVLTDGINNYTPDPKTVATTIVASNNITIHTVTFSPEADKTAMEQVATVGHGKHYHADTGIQLVAIFEEIANNLPTILTE